MTGETTSKEFDPRGWVWGHEDTRPRLLHTMVRVKNFEESIRFYTEGLGMKVMERYDIESRRVSAVFIGYGDWSNAAAIELTNRWDVDEQPTHGAGYGHVAVGAPDIMATVSKLEKMGFEIAERPKSLTVGGPMVAFVKDPNGYLVELIQTRRN